jgi:hypothetical protein
MSATTLVCAFGHAARYKKCNVCAFCLNESSTAQCAMRKYVQSVLGDDFDEHAFVLFGFGSYVPPTSSSSAPSGDSARSSSQDHPPHHP